MGYKEIAKLLGDMVANNIIKEGERLPSERELGLKYNVTRTTLRRAVDLLVYKGVLVRKAGSGTFVERNHIYFNIGEQFSFTEKMKSLGNECKTNVIHFELIESSDALNPVFNFQKREKLFYVVRNRTINGAVTTIENIYLPRALFPNVTLADMESSFYNYVEVVCGKKIKGSTNTIIPSLPGKQTASLFGISKETPIFQKNMVSTLVTDEIFEYCEILCNPKNYKFFYKSIRS